MMIRKGSLVKVLYPKYASESRGIVEAPEDIPGRWIIRLVNNPLNNSEEPLFLSLNESDIEVIFI
ncbi:MAG: hypothetical protein AAFW70_27780 [Cyanobacteria bacterium J06635_10]